MSFFSWIFEFFFPGVRFFSWRVFCCLSEGRGTKKTCWNGPMVVPLGTMKLKVDLVSDDDVNGVMVGLIITLQVMCPENVTCI